MTRKWEIALKIIGWASKYASVNRLLSHLARRTKSEASRELYCSNLFCFCLYINTRKKTNLTPDEIVNLDKEEVEILVQEFCDLNADSRRYATMQMQVLKTFFKQNGFKGDCELDLESYSLSGFGRKRPEYIPTLLEALKMADVAGSLKNRAIILVLLSTGLRVSTLCAILVGDIKNELERELDRLQIRVYSGMKEIVPNACKGRTEYTTFTSPKATEAIRLYLEGRARKFGEIGDEEPLFIPELGRLRRIKRSTRPMTSREIQLIVKEAAKKAGLKMWKNVTPHTLRKTFSSWVLRTTLIDGGTLEAKTQEILMGHKLPGSQEVYFDRTKPEELRKEYSRLNFTPRIKGRIEPFEIMKIILDVLGIDLLQSLSYRKANLNRDLTSKEQLNVIKDALQKHMDELKTAKISGKKAYSIKEQTNLTGNISFSSTAPKQTFLHTRTDQKTRLHDKTDNLSKSKLRTAGKSKTGIDKSIQTALLSFSHS